QARLWWRVEEIQHERAIGKTDSSGVRADRFEQETFLRFALILIDVLLRDLVQRRQKFYTNDAPKRIVGGHQQRTSFTRAQVDEGIIAEVETVLVARRALLQSVEHLVKCCRLCGLVRRMEHAQQPVAPSHGAASSVDAVIPVVVGIAVALPQTLRSGIARELPPHSEESAGRGEVSLVGGSIPPPLPRGLQDANLWRRIHAIKITNAQS